MALTRIVDRIKGMLSGGSSASSSRSNLAGDAAGPGHSGDGDRMADLRSKASGVADKAKAEASELAEQAKHAVGDLQHKAEEIVDRGHKRASSEASSSPDSSAMRDSVAEAADSVKGRASSGTQSDLTDRVEELKTSADAQVDDASNEFEERRS